MHTLPLPKVQTDLTANTKQVPNGQIESPTSSSPRPAALPVRLTAQQLQFLLRVVPAALASQREYGIPAGVTVAQAILESATAAGWGSSSLFRLANNPFGIKYCHFGPAHGLQPATPIPEDYGHFDAQTWEIENGQKKTMVAQFQRFPNLTEAFRCHALLLAKSPRYAPAMAAIRSDIRSPESHGQNTADPAPCSPDWMKFAERLGPKTSPLDWEHCGYSTNPSYSAELIKLVGLYRLNDPRALRWYAEGADPGPA